MIQLLVDGDIEAFRAAAATECSVDWGDGDVQAIPSLPLAYSIMRQSIEGYRTKFNADNVVVCLSSGKNFRKDINPEYKANRSDAAKPVTLSACKEWLRMQYAVVQRDPLEADDVMGIMSSAPGSIIVSIDKDMRGVPGTLYNPGKDTLTNISYDDAFMWHMMQTLTGDAVDGYGGCPGIGPKKAMALLNSVDMAQDDWRIQTWNLVVEMFAKKELSQEDALLNARMAYILRAADWDESTNTVHLWEPPIL